MDNPKQIHVYKAPKQRRIRDVHPEKWLGRGILICKGFVSELKRVQVNIISRNVFIF